MKHQRVHAQRTAKAMGFGQLYGMFLGRYIPRLLKWWFIFIFIFLLMVPTYAMLASSFGVGSDINSHEAEIQADITELDGYKDSDNDGRNDRNPNVPLTGIWEDIWLLRGSVPAYYYETFVVTVLVGFETDINFYFLPLEFWTAGLFYLKAFVSDPLGYLPQMAQLMFYWAVTLFVGTIPLLIIGVVIMWFFVAMVYGATPVIVGQAVKIPFRIFDWFTFLIRFIFIGWTFTGLFFGLMNTLIRTPLTIAGLLTTLAKIPLQILILMKMGFGFLIFVAVSTWGVIWLFTKSAGEFIAGIMMFIPNTINRMIIGTGKTAPRHVRPPVKEIKVKARRKRR
ncbi:MAG: hypothetical protein ACFE9L_14995 [Candidatus Hodarchaeota archaeon]